jgi:hypothetical protein
MRSGMLEDDGLEMKKRTLGGELEVCHEWSLGDVRSLNGHEKCGHI